MMSIYEHSISCTEGTKITATDLDQGIGKKKTHSMLDYAIATLGTGNVMPWTTKCM